MTWNDLLLCVTALAAGMINAVAGGGTLLTFPALYAALGPPRMSLAEASVVANGTSTMALWPGSLGSFWGYRREFAQAGTWVWWLLFPCLLGGLIGALLATEFPGAFEKLVPWLIFSAAMLFALQPQIARWTGIGKPHPKPSMRRLTAILFFQLLVSIYGGYFGAGAGILMLAALAMMGLPDIHVMNGVKTLYGTTINIMASIVFIVRGMVDWRLAVPMLIAGTIGGYVGARSRGESIRRSFAKRSS